MRKLFLSKGSDDVGAIGIGAMIVFIALILVAGIAASVLVQTSNTVQIQALQTGQQTTREVASGLSVFEITGQKGLTGLENLSIVVRCRAGSPDIDLNNTYVLISDGLEKALLRYGYDASLNLYGDSPTGEYFSLITGLANCNKTLFGIAELQDYDSTMSQTNPVINRGDKAVLFIRCSSSNNGTFNREIPVRTEIEGRVIPEVGSSGVISFTSPMSYVDTIYKLQ